MRKLLTPFLAVVLFTACQKEINKDNAVKTPDEKSCIAARGSTTKIDVCHLTGNGSYHTISINMNALPEHLSHGDIIPDADGDGYTKMNPCGNGSQDDCNDDDATINPRAAEICGNNIDENCNGEVDEEGCIPTVTICNQTWMLKNLDVATYRDGTPIPQVTDPTEWANLTTGAWCYQENNSANGTTYGKLYNFYAVAGVHDNDPNTPNKVLAPAGWHVPTDAEWTVLSDCLGGSLVAGGKMKETGITHWLSPNTDATNSSGFTALPGGIRENHGPFNVFMSYCFWWSSTEGDDNWDAWYRVLFSFDGSIDRGFDSKKDGMSVRCLRD